MNDRYLFRGKSLETGEWVYGGVTQTKCGCCDEEITLIHELELLEQEARKEPPEDGAGRFAVKVAAVDAKTVGQCTGIYSVTTHEIFEGDVLSYNDDDTDAAQVIWDDGEFVLDFIARDYCDSLNNYMGDGVIIGNIHDNPELLEVKS